MPLVKMSEMYDMRTTLNRVGIIGIKTPNSLALGRRWRGLMFNYKYMRLVKCDVRVACASLLPADPLQVGTTAGQVAPQDLMNPLLYKAVTNEGWDALLNRIYGAGSTVTANSVKVLANATGLSDVNAETFYYNILGNGDWRKAMPQQGLTMHGLRPFVYEVVNTFGNTGLGSDSTTALGASIPAASSAGNYAASTEFTQFRGKARPYPALPTINPMSTYVESAETVFVPPTIPESYVGAIVLPPSKLNVMYFRMIIDWYVEFSGLVSIMSRANYSTVGVDATGYIRGYTIPESTSKESYVSGTLSDVASEDDVVTSGTFVESLNAPVDIVSES